jgi:uncharacterized protein YegP (UPF0339 family)
MPVRQRFEIVTGDDEEQPYHVRLKGGNSKKIASTENFKTKRSAYRAVAAIAAIFSVGGRVWWNDDKTAVCIALDFDVFPHQQSIDVLEVDERAVAA